MKDSVIVTESCLVIINVRSVYKVLVNCSVVVNVKLVSVGSMSRSVRVFNYLQELVLAYMHYNNEARLPKPRGIFSLANL